MTLNIQILIRTKYSEDFTFNIANVYESDQEETTNAQEIIRAPPTFEISENTSKTEINKMSYIYVLENIEICTYPYR